MKECSFGSTFKWFPITFVSIINASRAKHTLQQPSQLVVTDRLAFKLELTVIFECLLHRGFREKESSLKGHRQF